jgi:hypothetical protein
MVDPRILALLAGAAIGYAAATYRGYSLLAGAISGAIFGPIFAWALFLIDGILRPNEGNRCHYCREWMKTDATVCPHCGRGIPAPSPGPGFLRLVHSRRD